MFHAAGFGEVMIRLSPKNKMRFSQVLPGELEATFGGAEANVCVSLARLGADSCFLTALPRHEIADTLTAQLNAMGCSTSRIRYDNRGRLGIYYAEHGSNMRSSTVLYDRTGTTIALLRPEDYDFEAMLKGITHLHLSGITPALSQNAYETTLALARYAANQKTSISVDLNFRNKLWKWQSGLSSRELAARCMSEITSLAEVIIGNEEDTADIFGIISKDSQPDHGCLNLNGYADVARKMSGLFPKARYIATTLRESISAEYNRWGGLLYDCTSSRIYTAPLTAAGEYQPYDIANIVDRFGGGDAFCAGLLFALNTPELSDPATAIQFAVAAGALKHTVKGDFNYSTREEIENLMKGTKSGRVRR